MTGQRGRMYDWMETYEDCCKLLGLSADAVPAQILDAIHSLKNSEEQLRLLREAVPDWAERLLRWQTTKGGTL